MPLFLLLGAGAAFPIISNAIDNLTEKSTKPTAGGVSEISGVIKTALLIGGTIIAIKYGSKLIKKI